MEKRRINVRGIIWRDGKLLAVKHKTASGDEAGYWAIPGGGLDPLELTTDGVKRELLEKPESTHRLADCFLLSNSVLIANIATKNSSCSITLKTLMILRL